MCGIKVCDYIRWKPDIDINVWYKGLWLPGIINHALLPSDKLVTEC